MFIKQALLQLCFLHNPAHCIGLEVLKLTKKTHSVTDLQCKNIAEIYNNTLQVSALPTAFFQISYGVSVPYYCPCIISTNNSAGIDGNFLYGGLLDRSIHVNKVFW